MPNRALIFLDTLLDKRLIGTFVQCSVAIVRFRNNKQGLWLSELGSYMDGYDGLSTSALAGTKRIGNLLRPLKWNSTHIDTYFSLILVRHRAFALTPRA